MIDRRRDLLDRLAAVPHALAALAHAASPEPPAPGEWTPSDIVRHLIAVEQLVWHARLVDIAATDQPTWPWTEPDLWAGDPGATLDQLLSTYAAARRSTTSTLEALDDAGWDRTGTHATYGILDVAGLMTRAVDHDEDHLRSFGASRP
jgi:hypothetical protein